MLTLITRSLDAAAVRYTLAAAVTYMAIPQDLPAQTAAQSCQPALFKIALDVGHSRASPGAFSATGITEFEHNLSLARMVLASLRQAGFSGAFLIGKSG